MPFILEDLIVDRVDLVDEGANSAAFIEVFKRKENTAPMDYSEILSKLKPEHAESVQQHVDSITAELNKVRGELEEASKRAEEQSTLISEQTKTIEETNEALAKANEELETLKSKNEHCSCGGEVNEEGVCSACGKLKKNHSLDEEDVLKSLPEELRGDFMKMRAQKEAAEEQVRKAAEEKLEAEAVAKADSLKALPVDKEVLVNVLKNCDPTIVEILTTAAAAIEGTMLTEVGKSGKGKQETDAWSKIEAEAEKVSARDSITKQKAIGIVIKENPELYKEYLNGGTN